MSQPLNTGDRIPGLTKTAYSPIEAGARNPIHTDEYARKYGLRGALVPGSTLLSYLLEMLYNTFGEKWLCQGKIKVNFIGGGAVNGDRLTAGGQVKAIDPGQSGSLVSLDIWLENQEGVRIVVGQASCLQ
jgi:acyl dehydratase